MDQGAVMDIARQGMQVALMVAAPILVVSLFFGILVSIFQAITSVQEMTLTFVPKLIGVGLVMLFFGSWMLTTLVTFFHVCLQHAARLQ